MSLRTVSFQDTYWSGENDLIKECSLHGGEY